MIKLAINGFGRIGRIAFRQALLDFKDEIEVVAINTSGSMEPEGWATLLKYDSVYRTFPKEVKVAEAQGSREIGSLLVEGELYPLLAEREPLKIPWFAYEPEVVIESTGAFRKAEEAEKHLKAGAPKVIISAPPKGEGVPIFLMGVNEGRYKRERIISNGSCTTNCVAPIVKLVKEKFGIEQAALTTIHAYTADQELVDGSHKDLRRARAAAQNVIPTETGAAESVIAIFPDLKGKFAGSSIRVPVICGSYSDLTFKVQKKATINDLNSLFQKAAEGRMKGILAVTSDPIVSGDIIGNPASSIVDLNMTTVVADDFIQVGAWYDNEWAYAKRLLEEAIYIAEK
ncbi:MAG TPA: type I glyceraldehyde-3-phosphate dehydrogenase [Patescibacteria group bacterium]|nr:type I glyceraldehyde-3-phosphate dehydrogenase [Patescibacteria group bacterium]